MPRRAAPRRWSALLARPALLATVALLLSVLVLPAPAQATPTVAPPTIVPFASWAPDDCPTPTGADVQTTQRLVVHHTHHPTAATREQVLPALAELCRLHVARGFDTAGYHYVIDPWGTTYQLRGGLPDADGRAPTSQPEGAHVHGGNVGATGVAFLGDHQATPPTDAAVAAGIHLLAWLVEATGRDPGAVVTIETTGGGTSLHAGAVDVAVLAGHSATNATLCPGEHLQALLGPIRDRVRAVVAGHGGTLHVDEVLRAAPLPGRDVAVTTSGPLLVAPPVATALPGPAGVAGLLPSTLLLAGALVLTRLGRPDRRRS